MLGWALFSLGLGAVVDRNADYVTGLVELVRSSPAPRASERRRISSVPG
ncbi:hypothetical protein [Streptomyces sp. NPDC060366]